MRTSLVVDDPRAVAYDFGPGHPMAPARLALTSALVAELGLLNRPGVTSCGAGPADDELLLRVHTPAYLAAVRAAGAGERVHPRHGIGTTDCPAFPGMHEAAARQCGAAVAAARAVWSGTAERSLAWMGGMHHAMPDRAAGFCVYNDAAVAITDLLAAGAERVAYLDLDVHHGDGVERVFWQDPRVLTVSVHQSPMSLFPGTGFAQDTGGPGAEGLAASVPLPPGTSGPAWLGALVFAAVPLLERFRPQVLVTQHGADVHALDPLAHLGVSLEAMRASMLLAEGLAQRYAGGRWVALGGGGYEVARVVPRAWAHLTAVVTGEPLAAAGPLPPAWMARVQEQGLDAPSRFEDGVPPLRVPRYVHGAEQDAVQAAVTAMRDAVLPRLGVDPAVPVGPEWSELVESA